MDASKLKDYYTRANPLVVFKVTAEDGSAPWGKGIWRLPTPGKKGAIRHAIDPLVCVRGIHGCPDLESLLCFSDATYWAPRLFVAELWGEIAIGDGKVAAEFGRLCWEVEGWDADYIDREHERRVLAALDANDMSYRNRCAAIQQHAIDLHDQLLAANPLQGNLPTDNKQ